MGTGTNLFSATPSATIFFIFIPLGLALLPWCNPRYGEVEEKPTPPGIGEVVEEPDFASSTTLSLPFETGDEEYLVILYSLGGETMEKIDYEITDAVEEEGARGGTAGGPEGFAALASTPGCFHPAIHEIDALRDMVLRSGFRMPPSRGESRAEVGDVETFFVLTTSGVKEIEAECTVKTDSLQVFNDITTENPLGEIEESLLSEMADGFGNIVLPRERVLFGHESDINEDGYITILFSYTVNEYGAAAYVSPCDLLDPLYCGYSNLQEIIYISIPDPDSTYMSPEGLIETMAHEFNHLIYFYLKYVGNDILDGTEGAYVTEGMAGLSQDLTGYNNGNLYVMWAGLDASEYYGSENYSIQAVSLNDIVRYNPGRSYYDSRDGALRGGAYLFFRYLFEQAGGMETMEDGSLVDTGGIGFLNEFFSSPHLDWENLEFMLEEPDKYIRNWFTALAISNRKNEDGTPLNTQTEFNYDPIGEDPLTGYQQGVDLWGDIHGWIDLTGPLTQTLFENDGYIRDGGVEYFIAGSDEAEDGVVIEFEKEGVYGLRYIRLK